MVKVYAVALGAGVVLLMGWIIARGFSLNLDRHRLDPEQRFGLSGRRTVAGLVGFGMGGMSAEFSPRDISWPLALALAVVASAIAAWYAGWVDRHESRESV